MFLYKIMIEILSADFYIKQLSLNLIGGLSILILRANFKVAKKAPLMVFCALYCEICNVTRWNLLYFSWSYDVYQVDSLYFICEMTTTIYILQMI